MKSPGLTCQLRFHLCEYGPRLIRGITLYDEVHEGLSFDGGMRLVTNVKLI